jgi:hypothetical protein
MPRVERLRLAAPMRTSRAGNELAASMQEPHESQRDAGPRLRLKVMRATADV